MEIKKELVKEFLNFRKQFTKREWLELNQAVNTRINEKADQLQLDDLDISVIVNRISPRFE